jgi:hypothetical protein
MATTTTAMATTTTKSASGGSRHDVSRAHGMYFYFPGEFFFSLFIFFDTDYFLIVQIARNLRNTRQGGRRRVVTTE